MIHSLINDAKVAISQPNPYQKYARMILLNQKTNTSMGLIADFMNVIVSNANRIKRPSSERQTPSIFYRSRPKESLDAGCGLIEEVLVV